MSIPKECYTCNKAGRSFICNGKISACWELAHNFLNGKCIDGETVVKRPLEYKKMTKKEEMVAEYIDCKAIKVILGIRMPDGSKEVIINDCPETKMEYICNTYDDNLAMPNAPIRIEEYMFITE